MMSTLFFIRRKGDKMKRNYVAQTKYICGQDAWETAEQFNEAMRELACLNPTYEREGNAFWIFYKVELVEEEEIGAEPKCNDNHAKCIDCPYLMRDLNRFGNVDARKKWGTCGRTGERTHIEAQCCDILTDLMERRGH